MLTADDGGWLTEGHDLVKVKVVVTSVTSLTTR